MPEGPEIRRAADTLEAAVKGQPLTAAWFAFPELKAYESTLAGQTITHIETRGKALLTHFSDGLTLYSHNQLYGVWRVVDADAKPETQRVLRVRLQTAKKAILLYSASDIEMLTPEQLSTHPFLQRVGPDVLDMRLTEETVRAVVVEAVSKSAIFRAAVGPGFSCGVGQLFAGRNPVGMRAGGDT